MSTHETTAAELLELREDFARSVDNAAEIYKSQAALILELRRELAAIKAQQPSGAQAGLVGRMAEALREAWVDPDGYVLWHERAGQLLREYDASPLPGEQPVAARVTDARKIADEILDGYFEHYDLYDGRDGQAANHLRDCICEAIAPMLGQSPEAK